MDSKKYIGMDVHKESISIAAMNGVGKLLPKNHCRPLRNQPRQLHCIPVG